MRRLFSATLLALFVVQSSGIASAAEYHHSGSVAWQMLNAQFRQSRLMALFDGQQTLFDLRQRVPHFTHITRQPILPDASISRRAVERFVGPGVPSVPVSMPKLPILPQNAPKDPLAMKRDAVSDAIVSGAGVQTIKHFTKKTASLTPMTTSQSYVTVAPSSVSGIAGGSASVATELYVWDVTDGGYADQGPCTPSSASSTNSSVSTATGNTIFFVGAGTATITFFCGTAKGSASVSVTAATPTPSPTPTPCPNGWSGTPPTCVAPTPTPTPQPTATPLATASTGVAPWWTFSAGTIPGAGKWAVNVANGNLAILAFDGQTIERGINLPFKRFYNSQSRHDYSNDDSSVPSNYGTGWTNTYDAHMSYSATQNIMSVYDETGARWDYSANGSGGWSAPAGQHSSLTPDGGCGYLWTQRDGIVYHFFSPTYAACAGHGAALDGRLLAIFGRNNNNNIQLSYSFDAGDDSSSAKLNQVDVAHSDGHALTLKFADFAGHRLLSSIVFPDNQTSVSYQYDNSANLIEVDRPGSGSGELPETYSYQNGYISQACSPRAVLSQRSSGGAANEGACETFYINGAGQPSEIDAAGVVNFTPADGMNIPLQSGPATGWVITGQAFFSGYNTTSGTEVSDDDGHDILYKSDQYGRVTSISAYTGNGNLAATQAWDSDNNLISTTDARGNKTDAAYDARGNITEVALPLIPTSNGSIRPTTVISYDQYNNVTSYCDPVFSNSNGLNWSAPPGPSDSRCPATTGTTRFSYDMSDGHEAYGKIIDIYTPLGNHTHFSYDTSGASGDSGLATTATSDSFSQNDGTSITPTRTAQYNLYGEVVTLGTGNGTWSYAYDALNRLTIATDPDGIASYRAYNADGSVSKTETAYQHATNTGVEYTYDADGNETSEKHYHGGTYSSSGSPTLPSTPATTTNFYDGNDRLVEVMLPYDSTYDVYTNPWITRYLYDLSKGLTVTFGSQNIYAHGNLYKMQQLVPPGSTIVSWSSGSPKIANTTFSDMRGWASDNIDRQTAQYNVINGQISTTSVAYDANGAYGLLTSRCNAVSQCGNPTYDAAGNVTNLQYTDGSTPNESYSYDPDLRKVSATWSNVGTQSYSYDNDGRMSLSQEPNGANVTSPATLTYHYYPNGLISSIDLNSSALAQTGILKYSYRPDGMMQTRSITTSSSNVGTTMQNFTFTAAGRFSAQTESGPGGNSGKFSANYSNGMLSDKAAPGGTFSNLEYDAEGMVLGYNAQVGAASPQTLTFTYTANGELALSATADNDFANGVAVANVLDSNGDGVSVSWDDLMAVPLGETSSKFSFDQAGRLVKDPLGSTRTFDANNHLTSESYSNSALLMYTWGPNGHPISVGSAFGSSLPSPSQVKFDTLHWDGDGVLFSTNPSNVVDDIKLGADGDIMPLDPQYTGLTSYDRDITGNVAFCHNATGANGTASADPYHSSSTRTNRYNSWTTTTNVVPCRGSGMQAALLGVWWGHPGSAMPTQGIGTGQVIAMPSPDGIADDFNIINGVRAYDPQLGTWETPDAYSGEIMDPMTMSSYAYADNNSANLKDFSGYATSDADPSCPDGTYYNANGPYGAGCYLPPDPSSPPGSPPTILKTTFGCFPNCFSSVSFNPFGGEANVWHGQGASGGLGQFAPCRRDSYGEFICPGQDGTMFNISVSVMGAGSHPECFRTGALLGGIAGAAGGAFGGATYALLRGATVGRAALGLTGAGLAGTIGGAVLSGEIATYTGC
jgi:YD repeat-containing protein